MASTNFRLAECRIRPAEHVIERAGVETHVEPRTMALLLLLAEHRGEVVSRQTIEERLWAGRVVGYDALTQAIAKLRRALGDDSHEPRFLLTIPKEGYRLIAEVRPDRTQDAAEEALPEDPEALRPPAPARRSWRVFAGFVALAVALAFIAGGWWSARSTPPRLADSRPSLAVLPFADHSANGSKAYLAEGLTEDLISSLTHFPELLVIARNSTLSFSAAESADIARVRQTLGVRYVVAGSVQSDQGGMRVQAHLVDAESNTQMWSQKWDQPRGDLLAIQAQIVDAISSRVLPHVQEAEKSRARRKPTANLDAYDLFQRARSEKHRLDAPGEARAVELLRQAIALDPNFAEAHALLGWTGGLYRVLTGDGPSYEDSLASVHRGLDLNPHQSLGHQALAQILTFMKRYDEAAKAGLRGIEINPNDAENHIIFSRAASSAGWNNQAIESAERAVRLNPLYPKWYPFIYGRALYADGQYGRAAEVCVEGMSRQAYVATALTCAATLERLGRHEQAATMVATARAMLPQITLARALDAWGFRDELTQRNFAADLIAAGLGG